MSSMHEVLLAKLYSLPILFLGATKTSVLCLHAYLARYSYLISHNSSSTDTIWFFHHPSLIPHPPSPIPNPLSLINHNYTILPVLLSPCFRHAFSTSLTPVLGATSWHVTPPHVSSRNPDFQRQRECPRVSYRRLPTADLDKVSFLDQRSYMSYRVIEGFRKRISDMESCPLNCESIGRSYPQRERFCL